MVYTGLVPRLLQFHVAPAMPVLDIKKKKKKKKSAIKLITHAEPHASAVSLLKRAENSAM